MSHFRNRYPAERLTEAASKAFKATPRKVKEIKTEPRSRLPKSWAKAGAFSPLTPTSKLAQY
jgi:hypothetical protein